MKKKRLLTDKMDTGHADKEVLFNMLEKLGWKRVILSRLQDNKHAVDIAYWLEENVKKPYERNGRDFIFECPMDAAWFILRWQ